MERDWLQHCATREQLDFFNEQGYLIVENALSEAQVEKMTVAIDRVDAAERRVLDLKPHQTMTKFRTIVEDNLFLDLLDNDKVFPLAWDILGWNIQHYISHLIVYPPEPEGAEVNLGGWHQDGGRPVREMERPHPRLSYKVSFWFSDTRVPNSGAMRIIPGSHRFDEKPPQEVFDQPDRFDIGRSPNRHLGFGWAEHYCLGAHLARRQITAMWQQLRDRVPEIHATDAPDRLSSGFINGVKHLECAW